LGTHVTLDQGTGCVHTAPGHGQEDYDVGLKYGLEVYAPVDDEGKFTEQAAPFNGEFVFDANKHVNTLLREKGALLKEEEMTHSYPHCWRCKNPVIFRSTEQWFISMDTNDLRRHTLDNIEKVEWIPRWGKDRIYAMIENRPDWCISRQRSWGVPIVSFYCNTCDYILSDKSIIDYVSDRFEIEGADCWFSNPASEFLPQGRQCSKCGGTSFRKDTNILDVWFDSGVSFASVLEKRDNLHFPADMYLEGSDQHRGWFHSSLLASVGTRGKAPYLSVLTHGFVVDGEGRKMSKSLGNIVPPTEIIEKYGVEILRMWVAAEDYRDDIRISSEILSRLSESYRKIRNTSRFLLSNLFNFDPSSHWVPYEQREELDRWASLRLERFIEKVREAYRTYDFHVVYHNLLEFCVVDLSAFYLDVLKEVLYISAPHAHRRRSAQTTLYEIVHALSCLIAPILSFTAEDIWSHIPGSEKEAESVHLCAFPSPSPAKRDPTLEERWSRVLKIRGEVSRALEIARKNKEIGHSLDAWVRIEAPEEWAVFLHDFPYELRLIFIVSEVTIEDSIKNEKCYESREIPGLKILVEAARGEKCARCWVYSTRVGEHPDHPHICTRCADELRTIQKAGGDT
jgi:isoleucyl-tRNA synthetase